MTWNADTLAALITEPESLEDLVTVLDDLTEADRSVIRKAIGKALPSLRRRMEKVGAAGQRLVLLAVAVGATPAQCAKVFSSWDIWRLMQVPITRDRLLSWMTGNGPEWAGDLITRMLKRRTADSMYYTELIDELALDIPIPDDPVFLTAWAVENSSFPRPGHRWEKHLIAACAAPNALGRRLVADQRTQIQAQIREAVADLRVTEPTDDDALLLALLQVFERGDNRPSQQFALILIAGLGLTPLLAKHSDRFLAALPNADPVVVKFAVEQLLPLGLDEDHLTTLALDVLVRKEKGVKRAVLKALRSVNDPSQDLVEMLTATTTGPDSTTAGLAQKLLDDWGVATGPAESLGLWRDPLGIPPEPIDDLDRLLDEVEFNELIQHLTGAGTRHREPTELHERGLAALVALGWAKGRDAFVETLRGKVPRPGFWDGLLVQQVQRWVRKRFWMPRLAPLTRFAARRCNDVLDAIGRVPCLLSTPTHKNNRVSWQKFQDRLHRYAEKNVDVLPIDLFVALGRIDRTEATPCTLPGRVTKGRTVQEIVDLWLKTPAEPGRMEFAAPGFRKGARARQRVRVAGDEPVVAKALGIKGPWNKTYQGPSGFLRERHAGRDLLPAHPTRMAMVALASPDETSAEEFTDAALVIRFDTVLVLTGLIFASAAPPQGRDEIAGALLTAWDESRLNPEMLVAAWESPWRQEWRDDIAPVKVAAMLTSIAEAGGLALAWPLLTRIAEELAGTDKLPTGVATILESVLNFLPEVPEKPDLPNITTLAARKSNSKTVKVARRIVDRLRAMDRG
ncbi:hypothetical protein EGT56_08150 [Arachnia propionica]|uniref:DUF7824 domain-containing protein n=1 Tax=Arachnia propionica TaxID=1750 RepID=UPI00026D3AF4|nr:DUF6493 family protein [Arachnia propionica]AFN45782.1 hypothetical protein HMPREF9154_0089 [Arachnia propionica F0230a]RPA17934.1 hypothetical protein EGT56_08150 [Arachnia propionica]